MFYVLYRPEVQRLRNKCMCAQPGKIYEDTTHVRLNGNITCFYPYVAICPVSRKNRKASRMMTMHRLLISLFIWTAVQIKCSTGGYVPPIVVRDNTAHLGTNRVTLISFLLGALFFGERRRAGEIIIR